MADICVDVVLNLVRSKGFEPNAKEADLIIKNIRKEAKRRNITSAADLQAVMESSAGKSIDMMLAARQQKREYMLRLIKYKANVNRIKQYVEDTSGTQSELDGLSALLMGDSTVVKGSRDSVGARTTARDIMFTGALTRELGDDLINILKKGDLDKDITLYQYNRNAEGIDPRAKQIHEILFKQANARREMKNREGAFIGEREDHLGRQTHDMHIISKTPRETWKADILRLVDAEKTFARFNTDQEIDEYLDELYLRFSTGKHYLADLGEDAPPAGAKTINLAKKISQSRTIHFKGGEEAFEYASKYSGKSIWDRTFEGIRYDARTITMLETFGPNPKAGKDSLLQVADNLAKARGADSKVTRAMIDSQFDFLNGKADIPAGVTLAEIGNGLRVLENVSKLGGAVISAFGDPIFKAATLNRRTSMGFFGSYVNAFTNMVEGVSRADRKHVAEMTNVYSEVFLASHHSRAGAIDGMPGFMSKLNELFFRWNLLQGWTVGHKKGLAAAISFDLGRYKNVAFDQLPDGTRRNLELHNITADEWAVIGKMESFSPERKKDFITPDGVYTIPDADIDAAISRIQGTLDVSDKMRASFKDTVAIKIQTLLHDAADEGVVTPGDRERHLLTAGTQKGTYLGEFLRFAGQFKAFPVTVITKQIVPTMRVAGDGKLFTAKGFAALVPMIMGTTALGYVSGAAKDMMKGKKPKDPKSLKSWSDAMLRGGGMGIFGDFMFAEYSRYGRSFQETALGPAIGTFSDALALAHKTATLKADAKDYFKFVKSITPGANLFYTEAAANYLFFNGLIEWSDPGYMARQERRLRKDYKQEFWLPPAAAF